MIATLLVTGAAAMIGDEGCAVYDNHYDGASTYAHAAQIFEGAFSSYDIWLGDDFTTDTPFTDLVISSTGFCGDGCVDPFQVTDFAARIWDGLPNDPQTMLILASTGHAFNGIDVWSSTFGDQVLPAGDYTFAFAADIDFVDGRTFFFAQARKDENNGFQWNPGGAFGFPDDLHVIDNGQGEPGSPNVCIDGVIVESCIADCDGNGALNVLDFVCFQLEWKSQTPKGDCDANGTYNVLDFVCFQAEFVQGCE